MTAIDSVFVTRHLLSKDRFIQNQAGERVLGFYVLTEDVKANIESGNLSAAYQSHGVAWSRRCFGAPSLRETSEKSAV